MANLSKRSPEKDQAIFDALRERPTYSHAARKAHISRTTLNEWRAADPDFARAVEQARHDGMEALEDRAVDRAYKESDTLMIFLLKGWRPDRYRERTDVNVSGNVTASVTVVLSQRQDGPQ